MKTTSLALKLHPDDNVAIARAPISQGTVVTEFGNIVVLADVPAAHKISLAHVNAGEAVLRYGQIIGFATQAIEPGDYVHTHNLEMATFERDYAFGEDAKIAAPAAAPITFQGFVRADGRVATRNYIGVVSTVNCSATVTKMVVEHFSRNGVLDAYPNVDGVVPITHSFGCCIEHNGEGVNQLRRTLGGFIKHANFAGVVVIGLGCEANQMGALFMAQGIETGKLIAPVVIQDVGGTRKAADAAIAAVESMLPVANECRREPVSARHLNVALQCGGSDG